MVSENIPAGESERTNSAFFTFVAVDKKGKPKKVAELAPESDKEIELFKGALRRRQLRLVLAKRMKPSEATEVKSLFMED